ncbi:MAG: ABC transporter ATP-binding protein, partial [Phycisphaerae bacterium]|nr:ABC transporter ATP-binding protein [Phycisphaerae bacterium]
MKSGVTPDVSVQPVISVVGLTKVYRDFWRRARVRAVNNLDLEVRPGEIFGLLGPNGSGKSTTIKIILGLLNPTRGRVTVFGRPPDDVRVKSRIGYLPEESYLYRFLNARETLDYYGTLFQLPRGERRRRMAQLLDMVGLPRHAARRPVGEYSKGMARRIGLAQALINDPDLLILDEPTSGLDPLGAKLVKDAIVRIGQEFKKTILLSSHLLADVEEVCHRVVILYGGRIQTSGTMEQVLARNEQVQLTGERLSPQTINEIQNLVRQREGRSLTVSVPRDRLEHLFLRIVREAHERQVESAGSGVTGEIAAFLGAEQQGREVIEQLVRVEPEPAAAGESETPQLLARPLTLLVGQADLNRVGVLRLKPDDPAHV